MWSDVVGWSIAVLTLAVGAGWVVSAQTRTLRRLNAEAELLGRLPSSAAKEILEKQIGEDVLEYTWLKHTESLRRLEFLSRLANVTSAVLLFVVFGMAAWVLFTRDDSLRLAAAAAGLAVVGAVLSVVAIRLRRRLDRELEQRRIREG